ncbi:GDSL esterase/lipase 1 [Morella rubra]|uniref:GDSL esterase/lipase 1 n=1 Tax=Morella rubra TaxID=262757 RepID=A0A6A1W1T7_9ROSI|nr:GDSL esterase/lipase 1 [Morella rubra]
MSPRFPHVCFLVLYASLIIPTRCRMCLPEDHVALFIFGDSAFDAGNNNYINTTTDLQANVWPYGETFFKYPTGRPSNGRLIPDFIAEYAKLPSIPPYLHPGYHRYTDGANFASAGAGALVETRQGLMSTSLLSFDGLDDDYFPFVHDRFLFLPPNQVIDLHTQLNYFKHMETFLRQSLGEADVKTLLSGAVYLFSV